jgi:hypothetical protein
MTEIPMPEDYQVSKAEEKEGGCCTNICNCIFMIIIAGIVIAAIIWLFA